MSELRSLIEREIERADVRPFDLRELERRRERARVRERATVIALVVLLVGIGVAVAVGSTGGDHRPAVTPEPSPVPPALRHGIVGLAPANLPPSLPGLGTLVLSYQDGSDHVAVYEDGRIVWERFAKGRSIADVPERANNFSTGALEQRLTPAGVEMLRARVLATGLFDRDRSFSTGRVLDPFHEIRVTDRGRLVSVRWNEPDARRATEAQLSELEALKAALTDRDWLPASAWERERSQAFVPSRYVVKLGANPQRPEPRVSDLPRAAAALLTGTCQVLSSADAHELARVMADAGIEPTERWMIESDLAYDVDRPVGGRITLWVYPAWPDDVAC